jgi:adenine-specific DNA-methyltransferase
VLDSAAPVEGDLCRANRCPPHLRPTTATTRPAGLADVAPLPPAGRKRYEYDPRLDPQLVWSGKAEHLTFDIETVPLHIHERLSPAAIVDSLRTGPVQRSMFADPEFDLNQAVEFYQHPQPWANRLVLGDSLLVMNSLLEREVMAGKVQCIYFDPPYGIRYASNFQPFVTKRDVKEGDDTSLTREPEQIRAFRDTWELGVHSYLTYIRDRLLLMREILVETGSIFVQISDEHVHRVRTVMDEVFGAENFCALIPFVKTSGQADKLLASICDYLIWYAKDQTKVKYRQLYNERSANTLDSAYTWIEEPNGNCRKLTSTELSDESLVPNGRRFMTAILVSQGFRSTTSVPYNFQGKVFNTGHDKHWKVTIEGLNQLVKMNRLIIAGDTLCYKRYAEDFPVVARNNFWNDTVVSTFVAAKLYTVQTATKVIARCILMTTDPGDLVFDPTCGSGTTAFVAEQWGRRWIVCDTSRVALSIARQRLMTATYPYYKLEHPEQGVRGAFNYKKVPHITLGSIANNEPTEPVVLYDQPEVDRSIVRVAGPFSVEAVQPPVLDPDEVDTEGNGAPAAADDAGSYLDRMIEQLRRGGLTVRGQHMPIKRISSLVGASVLHAECDYEQAGKNVTAAVIFGPQYGPLTSGQLQDALNEARGSYDSLIACAFTFDAPAHALLQKATLRPPVIGVAINADLLMGNLLKTSKSSQVFSVFGKPDITLSPPGPEGYTVTVRGVDIYDPNTGDFDASSAEQIAAWFLDTDYDSATFLVCQAYFPTQTPNPWEKIGRALKGGIDPEQFAALQRTTSLPFKVGKHRQCAVKVIDHRGNEVMTVLRLH